MKSFANMVRSRLIGTLKDDFPKRPKISKRRSNKEDIKHSKGKG